MTAPLLAIDNLGFAWPRQAELLDIPCFRLERGESLYARTVEAIRAALEAAGVEFIPENGGGPGVRLRRSQDHPIQGETAVGEARK